MLPTLRHRNYWPGIIDGFFGNDFFPDYVKSGTYNNVPAVNVTEDNDKYKIELAAPGLDKSDFHIDLDDNVLTISSERELKNFEEDDKVMRREFNYSSFKRCFRVPEEVDGNKIKAYHKDGILTVHLPKNEKMKKLKKEIKIA
jgi:HSP20 family protein